VILVCGRLAAAVATRFGLPGVFGELVLGLALGPFVVRWLGGGDLIGELGEVGVLVLMLLVGLETDVTVVRSVGKSALLVAFGGALLAAGLTASVALGRGQPLRVSLFIGVALCATSVSITAVTLRQMGRLDTPAGRTIMVAAVIDDVIGLLLVAMISQGGGSSPAVAGLRLIAFLGFVVAGGLVLRPLLTTLERHVEEFLAVAVGLGLLYAWAAQAIGGLAGITGAYAAGLVLARAMPHQRFAHGVESLASGFFATLFFVSLGLNVHLRAVSPQLVVLFGVLAITGKALGAGIGARLSGLSRGDTLIVSSGMVPQGEVSLIVAALGLREGLLSAGLFSTIVIAVLGTTLVTPVLLKFTCSLMENGLPVPAIAPRPIAGGSD